MFPACYGLANPLCAHISRMIVVERGLNILGAPIAERPAQPGFPRRTDGPYTWISFLKAFILSNPRVAATFTVLRATVSGTLVPPYAGPFLFMALTEHPGILRGLKLVRSRLGRASMRHGRQSHYLPSLRPRVILGSDASAARVRSGCHSRCSASEYRC